MKGANVTLSFEEMRVIQTLLSWNFEDEIHEGNEEQWEKNTFSLGLKITEAMPKCKKIKPKKVKVKREPLTMVNRVTIPTGNDLVECHCGKMFVRCEGFISGSNGFLPPECKECYGEIQEGTIVTGGNND